MGGRGSTGGGALHAPEYLGSREEGWTIPALTALKRGSTMYTLRAEGRAGEGRVLRTPLPGDGWGRVRTPWLPTHKGLVK